MIKRIFNWLNARPIPASIIFVFSSMQILAISSVMFTPHYFESVKSGAVSIGHTLSSFSFCLMLFLGGLFLFLLRKISILFFSIYFIWATFKIIADHSYIGFLSLGIIFGIIIYAGQLYYSKKLI